METETETPNASAIQSANDKLQHYYQDGEEYVRGNPTRASLIAIGAGFLLAQLPLRFMILGLLKCVLLLVKPATFIYAISKLMDDVKKQSGDNNSGAQ